MDSATTTSKVEPPGFEYRFLEDSAPRSFRPLVLTQVQPQPTELAEPEAKIQIGPVDV